MNGSGITVAADKPKNAYRQRGYSDALAGKDSRPPIGGEESEAYRAGFRRGAEQRARGHDVTTPAGPVPSTNLLPSLGQVPYCECGHCHLEELPRSAWMVAGSGDLERLAVLPGHEKPYVDTGSFVVEDFGTGLAVGYP